MILYEKVPDFEQMTKQEIQNYQKDLHFWGNQSMGNRMTAFTSRDLFWLMEEGVLSEKDVEKIVSDIDKKRDELLSLLNQYEERTKALFAYFKKHLADVRGTNDAGNNGK